MHRWDTPFSHSFGGSLRCKLTFYIHNFLSFKCSNKLISIRYWTLACRAKMNEIFHQIKWLLCFNIIPQAFHILGYLQQHRYCNKDNFFSLTYHRRSSFARTPRSLLEHTSIITSTSEQWKQQVWADRMILIEPTYLIDWNGLAEIYFALVRLQKLAAKEIVQSAATFVKESYESIGECDVTNTIIFFNHMFAVIVEVYKRITIPQITHNLCVTKSLCSKINQSRTHVKFNCSALLY